MTATAQILARLETITFESQRIVEVIDEAMLPSPSDRHEAKRRVLEIQAKAQEVFDWFSEMRLEDRPN